jgi:membrane fusion protein (multidrug efflux system)
MSLSRAVALLLPILLADPAAAQQAPRQDAAPAAAVGVVQAERRPVTQGASFVGRLQAAQRVELRARVTGFLERVAFTEGQLVEEGAELFQIEQAPFLAALHEAEAAVQRAVADHRNAALQRQRADELVRTNSIPVATRDQRIAEEAMAQASVASAEASLERARVNIGYTTITAPIAGRIGRSALTRGNVVGPESGVLALLVSQDPMHVVFPVSQRQFLELRRRLREGRSQEEAIAESHVRLHFSDGTEYGQVGRINFVDVTVDRATDTVTVRAAIPNPDGILVDGQYANIVVEGDRPEERVVVPQAALVADQEGVYVLVVEDGKAAVRRVRTGASVGAGVVVQQGLAGGEQVIVDGLQRVRAGQAVRATPAQRLGDRS